MNDREFLMSMIIIHTNELIKYLKTVDSDFPINRTNPKTKNVALQFDQTLNRITLFRSIITPAAENEKEIIDFIASCYSDLGRKLLDSTNEERQEKLVQISEFFDSL